MGDWNRVFFPAACLWGLTLWGTHSEAPAAPLHWLSCASTSLADCAYLHHSVHSTLAIAREPPPGAVTGWPTRLQVHQALSASSPALSAFSCVSAVSLTFFFFFFSSPGFSSKGEPRNWPGIQGSFPFLLISSLLSLSSVSEKKKSMGQVSENRSLTAEG